MKKHIPCIRYFLLMLLLGLSLVACLSKQTKTPPKDDLKEWQNKAKDSQPYLPHRRELIDVSNLDNEASADTTATSSASQTKVADQEALVASLPKQPISVRFVDEKLATVLRTLARIANQNILLSPTVTGTINTDIRNTPWNKVFMSLINSYGLIVTFEENLLHVMSIEDMKQQIARKSLFQEEEQVEPLVTQIIPIEFSDPEKIAQSLDELLSQDKNGKKRGSVSVDTHSRSIIIRETTENIKRLTNIIYDLDQPTPQILINAQIVEAKKDTARELGVRWGSVPLRDAEGNKVFDSDGTLRTLPEDLGEINLTSSANFLGAGANLGILTRGADFSLDIQLSALQSQGKINILSSPSIATLDNNKAVIESGTTIPYPDGKDEQGNIIYSKAQGTLKLTVTPHVIQNKFIKLDILAQNNEVDLTRSVGGVPFILTKTAETKLIVINNNTVVIAGLSKEKQTHSDSGVPILKDIPYVGQLFKNDSSANDFEDLLIFITPTILTKSID